MILYTSASLHTYTHLLVCTSICHAQVSGELYGYKYTYMQVNKHTHTRQIYQVYLHACAHTSIYHAQHQVETSQCEGPNIPVLDVLEKEQSRYPHTSRCAGMVIKRDINISETLAHA